MWVRFVDRYTTTEIYVCDDVNVVVPHNSSFHPSVSSFHRCPHSRCQCTVSLSYQYLHPSCRMNTHTTPPTPLSSSQMIQPNPTRVSFLFTGLPCFQTRTDLKDLLGTLGQNVVTKKRKNVEILWLAGTVRIA